MNKIIMNYHNENDAYSYLLSSHFQSDIDNEFSHLLRLK